jgi:D-3-phosphoglycerate dehydrogenase
MKILLTHNPFLRANYYGDRSLAGLRALADVTLHEDDEPLSPPQLIAAAGDVDVIVSDRLTLGAPEIFGSLPKLRAFVRCAVDIRNIDVPAASRAGVLVTRAGPGFVPSMVEMTLGYLVDLSRGVSRAVATYHRGEVPKAQMGRQLSGSTAGIIGYGSIGRALAPVLATIGMNVLIADPYAEVADPRFAPVSFEELLARADYVICLAVANAETEKLINGAALARMQPHAYFLNLSRGDLVDEDALFTALTEGRIAGAAMDVGRAPDQMPTPALAKLPNVIATPHAGGLTPPAIEFQALETVRQVASILKGEAPQGAVNPDHWNRRA